MLRLLLFLALLASSQAGTLLRKPATHDYLLEEGDIVFQGTAGPQGDAVRVATASPYTHCGIVFQHDGQLFVMEAVQPVKSTPLDAFIQRSLPGTFHAMRLKTPPAPDSIAQARQWAAQQSGLDYDLLFAWSDDQLYCSEFVWKTFHKAGIELCQTRPFRSYQLKDPKIRHLITQRYGGPDKLPLDEPAVAPSDLATSKLLVEVPRRQNYKKR